MRAGVDTNLLISSLLLSTGNPAEIYQLWRDKRFRLITCDEQLEELRTTLGKPSIAERIKPWKAGRLVNDIRKLAERISPLPSVQRSPDPADDFLLALAEAGRADYLVSGDKKGLLVLGQHKSTRIVAASEFVAFFGESLRKQTLRSNFSK